MPCILCVIDILLHLEKGKIVKVCCTWMKQSDCLYIRILQIYEWKSDKSWSQSHSSNPKDFSNYLLFSNAHIVFQNIVYRLIYMILKQWTIFNYNFCSIVSIFSLLQNQGNNTHRIRQYCNLNTQWCND